MFKRENKRYAADPSGVLHYSAFTRMRVKILAACVAAGQASAQRYTFGAEIGQIDKRLRKRFEQKRSFALLIIFCKSRTNNLLYSHIILFSRRLRSQYSRRPTFDRYRSRERERRNTKHARAHLLGSQTTDVQLYHRVSRARARYK